MYDLEERCGKFGERIILFIKTVPVNRVTDPLVKQLIRSATSIGANYMEANGASSPKDFRNKISICRKEANETKHWLRMIATAEPSLKKDCQSLWKETQELVKIFWSIFKKTEKRTSN